MRGTCFTGVVIGLVVLICLIPASQAFSFGIIIGLTESVAGNESGSIDSKAVSVQESEMITEVIPQQWQRTGAEGSYVDPVSRTTWTYDRMLKRFFCPQKIWFLISQYSKDNPPRLVNQYYYDPLQGVLIDMQTGDITYISQNSNGGGTVQISGATMTPSPAPTPVETQAPIDPVHQEPKEQEMSEQSSSETKNTDPCLVECPRCADGFCLDCNHDQICDTDEEVKPAGTEQTASTQDLQIQEQNISVEGGLSEDPQSTIYKITNKAEPRRSV